MEKQSIPYGTIAGAIIAIIVIYIAWQIYKGISGILGIPSDVANAITGQGTPAQGWADLTSPLNQAKTTYDLWGMLFSAFGALFKQNYTSAGPMSPGANVVNPIASRAVVLNPTVRPGFPYAGTVVNPVASPKQPTSGQSTPVGRNTPAGPITSAPRITPGGFNFIASPPLLTAQQRHGLVK